MQRAKNWHDAVAGKECGHMFTLNLISFLLLFHLICKVYSIVLLSKSGFCQSILRYGPEIACKTDELLKNQLVKWNSPFYSSYES